MTTRQATLEYLTTTKIGEKGQLTVPKQFRKDPGLGKGGALPYCVWETALSSCRNNSDLSISANKEPIYPSHKSDSGTSGKLATGSLRCWLVIHPE
jgi:hypothetical protein